MDIIVPHANTDLDALGAAVGAQILYPRAHIVFPGALLPGATEFASLHRYQLRARQVREVDLRAVGLMVVVDTLDPARVGKLETLARREGMRLHLYDHHPREPGDLDGEVEVWDPVGACSTLLAEILAETGHRLSPFQATALLLGIYSDTGSLTLPGTTPRDVRAAAYLLEEGASLRLVERFVRTELTPPQQELLAQLVASSQVRVVKGVKVRLVAGATSAYVGGLAHVVHKLTELQPAPATFVGVRMGDRVHLVGRSEVPWVDVARVLRTFGGGGHPAAAAAVVKGGDPRAVLEQVEEVLDGAVGRPVTARDIMKSPVRAVPPTLAVAEAEKLMLRYGHSGLVVADGGAVVGLISRRDAEKARRHGLAHAPVKGVMSRPATTVPPDMPLDEVQSLLVERDIGRLPVVRDGALIGIITRSDLLQHLYGSAMPHWHHTLYRDEARPDAASAQAELVYKAAALPAEVSGVLRAAGQVARATAVPAYAVGGFIRDLLLRRSLPGASDRRPGMLDVDVVVEGDGIDFATALGQALGARVEPVPRFATAHMFLPSGLRVDVATARREFYEYAAALPQVEHGNMREDLYRRDFSINAMAARLTPAGVGDLVDFFGGYADLKAGLVRVLHSLSFVEDPTRILRAVRFANRYGFRLEPETERLIRDAVSGGFVERVSAERLRNELVLILHETAVPDCLAQLAELGSLERVLPEVAWSAGLDSLLRGVQAFLAGIGPGGGPLPPAARGALLEVQGWLLYACALGTGTRVQDVPPLVARLRLQRRPTAVLLQVLSLWREALATLEAPGLQPSDVVAVLDQWPAEGTVLLWLQGQGSRAADRVRAYWSQYRRVRPSVTSADLRRAGVPPGPGYGRALAEVKRAKLDGRVRGKEQELALALAVAREVAGAAAAQEEE